MTQQLDLNEVIEDVIDEHGVQPITVGAQVCASVRAQLRCLIRASDPEGYAEYRAIKYPGGESTPESRVAATRFIFDRARDLLAPHYVPTQGG